MEAAKQFENLAPLIANTPLLQITFHYKGEIRYIYAKAEHYNLTGSIKDRVAYHILRKAYQQEKIQKGDLVVEATSGNTGISFSAIASYLGHSAVIYMPDWMSRERISLTESFGAKVHLVSKDEGGFLGSIEMAEALGKQGGVFLPRQFSNEDNVEAHYLTTGEEIVQQLNAIGKTADGIVAGVGTGGTVMGIGKRLREANAKVKSFPLEPLNSPTLSTGYKTGKHRIYGISDEFVPSIVDFSQLNDIVSVDDGDAITMAQKLSRELGLGVGVSSGANFIGSVMAQELLGKDSTIVTVFADDNKKYLSTDYVKPQPVKETDYSKEIQLLDVKAYR